jgi:pilus assembly protein CpaB
MLLRRKMPRASFVLLSVSLACAVSAALVMQAYARRLDASRPDGGPPTAVVTAARDIPRGTTLSADALTSASLPARFVPPGALRDPARAVGRVVVTDLAAGEVVTRLRVAGGDAGRIASLVPSGMRAVQLPVAAAAGVEPGDRVDVLATFGGGGAHTELAAEGVEVLAFERAEGTPLGTGGGGDGAVGLLVLVGTEDTERLAFAATFATLSVAVRGPDDAIVLGA